MDGNPADRIFAGPIDHYLAICRIETDCGTQPELHETARTQDGVGKAAFHEPLFHLTFGIPQWEILIDIFRKRSVDEMRYVVFLGCLDQICEALQVRCLYIVHPGLVGEGHCGNGRDDSIDSFTGIVKGSAIANIPLYDFHA